MFTFSEHVLKICIAQLAQNIGWDSINSSSFNVLIDLCKKFIKELGKSSSSFANQCNRTEVIFEDILLSFNSMGFKTDTLKEYLKQVPEIPFAGPSLPIYPIKTKGTLRIQFPNELEIKQRDDYYNEWLPTLNPYSEITNIALDLKENLSKIEELDLDLDNSNKEFKNLNTLIFKSDIDENKMIAFKKTKVQELIIGGYTDLDAKIPNYIYLSSNGEVLSFGGKKGKCAEAKKPPLLDEDIERLSDEKRNIKLQKLYKNNKPVVQENRFINSKYKDKRDSKFQVPLKIKLNKNKCEKRKYTKKKNVLFNDNLEEMHFKKVSIEQSGKKINDRKDAPISKTNTMFIAKLSDNDALSDNLDLESEKKFIEKKSLDLVKCKPYEKITKKSNNDISKNEFINDNLLESEIKDILNFILNKIESEEKSISRETYDENEAARTLMLLSCDSNRKCEPLPINEPLVNFVYDSNNNEFSKLKVKNKVELPIKKDTVIIKSEKFNKEKVRKNLSDKVKEEVINLFKPDQDRSEIINSDKHKQSIAKKLFQDSSVTSSTFLNKTSNNKIGSLNKKLDLNEFYRNENFKSSQSNKNKLLETKKITSESEFLDSKQRQTKFKKNKEYLNSSDKFNVQNLKENISKSFISNSPSIPKLKVKISSGTVFSSTSTTSPTLTDIESKTNQKDDTFDFSNLEESKLISNPVKTKTRSNRIKSIEKRKKESCEVLDILKSNKKCKSSHIKVKKNCVLITETVENIADKIWYCPSCSKPDDGTPMIGCDGCDNWHHWICVGISTAPKEDKWYCENCLLPKSLKSERQKQKLKKMQLHSLEKNEKFDTKIKQDTPNNIFVDYYNSIGNPSLSTNNLNKLNNTLTYPAASQWVCPKCLKIDDGTPMIGCDKCDNWYHWICVGIEQTPTEDSWFCKPCIGKSRRLRKK